MLRMIRYPVKSNVRYARKVTRTTEISARGHDGMSAWHRLHARRRNSAATAMVATQYASRITWGLRIEVIAAFSGSGARGVEKVSTSPAWPTQVRIPVEVAPASEVLTSVS